MGEAGAFVGNTDLKDDIFSHVEIQRGAPEVPALRPPKKVRPVTGYGKYIRDGPGGTGDRDKKMRM